VFNVTLFYFFTSVGTNKEIPSTLQWLYFDVSVYQIFARIFTGVKLQSVLNDLIVFIRLRTLKLENESVS
jgi:hypothetical protein